jgi:hypothetical protein
VPPTTFKETTKNHYNYNKLSPTTVFYVLVGAAAAGDVISYLTLINKTTYKLS